MNGGQSETRCIEVIYTGSLDAGEPIKFYGGYSDTDGDGTKESTLAPYLDLSVEIGAADSTCANFAAPATVSTGSTLAAFTSAHKGWVSGVSTGWTPTGGATQTRPFRITLTVEDDNNAQAKTVEPVFMWEVHSS